MSKPKTPVHFPKVIPPTSQFMPYEEKPRKPQLMAQWHTVDGKLECRWLIVIPF